jgi:hypothetical protein
MSLGEASSSSFLPVKTPRCHIPAVLASGVSLQLSALQWYLVKRHRSQTTNCGTNTMISLTRFSLPSRRARVKIRQLFGASILRWSLCLSDPRRFASPPNPNAPLKMYPTRPSISAALVYLRYCTRLSLLPRQYLLTSSFKTMVRRRLAWSIPSLVA